MEDALQSSVYVSSPEFAGWLIKRGFRWRKLWKKRWVALHGAEIVYMDMEPTVENSASLTITKAQITTATVIDRDDVDGDPNGFAIHINDGSTSTWHLRAESIREKKSWIMRLTHVHAIVKWLEDFEKVRVLGVGGTGIVYELLHKSNGQRFAMKEMEIKNKTQMKMAVSEAEMLKDIMENVSHPNIMHIERVFQVGSKFYMVFPLCTGGELYEHIIRRGHFTEHDAAMLTRDLVSGLHALHEHDILHLDIKPENILFDSMDDDAKIKITDFGLSKVFSRADQVQQNSNFSMKLMNEKLAAFLEAGETYKEQLRGTIGYMSPELILTGHCSKATDVFAAGVVLYILLCGRPPFNSKANREVLEKTARGVYRLSGGEWDSISEEAKDLVKRMLDSNPLERITTAQILQHPWLQQLDDDEVGELGMNISIAHLISATDKEGTGSNKESSNGYSSGQDSFTFTKKLSKKRSGANLVGTLRQLSGLVKQRRSEKLATNLSRIVSSLLQQQEGGVKRSTLALQYLVPTDIANNNNNNNSSSSAHHRAKSRGSVDGDGCEPDMLVLNSEFRTALVNALGAISELEDGKLTIEQFGAILTQLIGVNTVSLTTLLMGRFVDRDGDGYISADDIFAVQAMLMQRSEIFLRQIAFRVYTESLWYPGRQFNLINAKQQIPRKSLVDMSSSGGAGSSAGTSSTGGTPIKMTPVEPVDVVEPPKLITARHVAAVFEKMGYDAASGTKVFGVLLELLAQDKARQLEEESEEQEGAESTTTTGSAGGTSSNGTGNSGGTASSAAETAVYSDEQDLDPAATRASEANRDSFFTTPLYARKPRSSFTAALPFATSSAPSANAKMDVADFVRAVELDDILVQALTRKARLKMLRLMRKAEEQFLDQSRLPAAQHKYASPTEVATAMLSEEFRCAFQQCKGGSTASARLFP